MFDIWAERTAKNETMKRAERTDLTGEVVDPRVGELTLQFTNS
jgi:hypothetical protein